jgi:2-methylisocitrate lyase-like PEP mutase family enzyme
LIHCGIVGINIEDSEVKGDKLISLGDQCERIRLIRRVSNDIGVPIVINARTDVFLLKNYEGDRLAEAIIRGQNYKDAGADCFYPILCSNDELKKLNLKIELPINVLVQENTPSIKELQQLGIARLSLGPSLLKAAVTKMREVVVSLKNNEGYGSFINEDTISSAEIVKIIKD